MSVHTCITHGYIDRAFVPHGFSERSLSSLRFIKNNDTRLRRVTISDINDNAPLFDHLPAECVVVTEFHAVGDMILLIKAMDADDPNTVNGRVTFSIEDGNERGQCRLATIIITIILYIVIIRTRGVEKYLVCTVLR